MLKRLKLPGWLVLILLLVGVFFGFNKVIAKVFEEPTPTQSKEIVESSGIYPGVNIETQTKETDLYTLSVSRLYTKHDQINQQIDEWINEEKADFKSSIKDFEDSLRKNDLRAHLNIRAKTETIANNVYKFEFEAYQITGGANGVTHLKSFIVDLNQKKHLEIGDVFQLNDAAITDIKELVIKKLHSNDEDSFYIFDDLAEDVLADPDDWKWSISQDKMTFYFDQYEIAAGAAGALEADIPLEEIKPYLKKSIAEAINIKIPEQENNKSSQKSDSKKQTQKNTTLDPDGKYLALTFDDGPHPNVTPKILETLKKTDTKATFYMLGSQVKHYPSLANDVKNAGHEIGDHTMNHMDLSTLNSEKIKEEMESSHKIIEETIGQKPTSMRPPYGAWNKDVKQLAKQMDTPIIMWSVDSLDWKNRNATKVHDDVMSLMAPGAIVLLHDIHPSTAEALPQIIASLKEQDYQMVSVSELLELQDKTDVGPFHSK